MTGASSLTWIHVGDLHMDEATDWASRDRLAAIVAEIDEHVGDETTVGSDRDVIDLLVRGAADTPRSGHLIAPGCDIHGIGAWPEHGIPGGQLGLNKNGKRW